MDSILNASSDMVNVHTALILYEAKYNYLRIQELALPERKARMDNSTKENLDKLKKIGNDLLEKHVRRLDLETRRLEPDESRHPLVQKNRHALDALAIRLSKEKNHRGRSRGS